MRRWLPVLLGVALLMPTVAAAHGAPRSAIQVAHRVLQPGQAETITVTARNLNGDPLVGAAARAVAIFGRTIRHFRLARTDTRGVTKLVLHPSRHLGSVRVTIEATVTDGYLSIPLSTQFTIASGTSPTPTATAIATPSSDSLDIVARAVPDPVAAPDPTWIVAFVHTSSGVAESGALVQAVASFQEGQVTAAGRTDASGVAMLEIDTSSARGAETVPVHVQAQWTNLTTSSDLQFGVTVEAATATPTETPTGTAEPPPTATPVATSTPTATAASTAMATPAATNTATPQVTWTPLPTPTLDANCRASITACQQDMLAILNNDRTQYARQYPQFANMPLLQLNQTQSNGTGSCVGSIGHSEAMAQSGYIWHQNSSYPAASWPTNVCIQVTSAGENVGMASGSVLQALQTMDMEMMSEPHDPATCATTINHACNTLNPNYPQVGIGIYVSNGSTWLTEDFLG